MSGNIGWLKQERDILLAIVFVSIILYFQIYGPLKEFTISIDTLLQSYVTIITIVLAVFTIFSLYGNIIKSIQRKGYTRLIKRHFYTPIIASTLGVFVSILQNVLNSNYILALDIFFFMYAVLSMLETFIFIFNILFEMHK